MLPKDYLLKLYVFILRRNKIKKSPHSTIAKIVKVVDNTYHINLKLPLLK